MRPTVITIDNVLTADQCQEIIDTMRPDLAPAKVEGHAGWTGSGVYAAKVRKSNTCFIKPNDTVLESYVQLVQEKIARVADKNHCVKLSAFQPAQFTEYRAFGYYKPHLDTAGAGPAIRTISASLELSDPDDYIGGGLSIYNNSSKPRRLKNKRGSLTIFSSLLLHQANTVWWGRRYSLVLWGLEYYPKDVREMNIAFTSGQSYQCVGSYVGQ